MLASFLLISAFMKAHVQVEELCLEYLREVPRNEGM